MILGAGLDPEQCVVLNARGTSEENPLWMGFSVSVASTLFSWLILNTTALKPLLFANVSLGAQLTFIVGSRNPGQHLILSFHLTGDKGKIS